MRKFLTACMALLIAFSVPPAAGQEGDEWTGTVAFEDPRVEEYTSEVSVVRLADGTFFAIVVLHYITNPDSCGEAFFRQYEGTGVLSPGGETISFDGDLSGTITSTCGERVTETGGPAGFSVAVDGGNISGYLGVGTVDLNGPLVVEPVPDPGFEVRDGSLYIEAPPGEVLNLSRADLPDWAAFQIAVVGAMSVGVGPPDTITTGDDTVLLDGLPIARVNDMTAHGGVIVEGSDRIFVNGVPVAVLGSMTVDPMVNGNVPFVGGPIVFPVPVPASPYDPNGCTWCDRPDVATQIDHWSPEQRARLEQFLRQGRTLDLAATAGDTKLEVDGSVVEIGDGVAIGSGGENIEFAVVAGKGSIILDRPLEFDHAAGTVITRLSPEVTAEIESGSALDPPEVAIDSPTGSEASDVGETDADSGADSGDESSGVPIVVILGAVGGVVGIGFIVRQKSARPSSSLGSGHD